jgi:catechol 2,3-dioxygenase-like lactoylglutathione lyase family enzyme
MAIIKNKTAIHLNTVGVVVRDMPKALGFYRLLGLSVPTEQDDQPHVEFTDDNGYSIGFVTEAMVRQTDPTWNDAAGHRINLQFKCDEPSEVDATHARLIDAGHASHQAPWDAFWGQRFARVIDPDGNVVNIFAELQD